MKKFIRIIFCQTTMFTSLLTGLSGQTNSITNPAWDIKKLNTAAGASYMKDNEKEMVLEINKLRSNPGKFTEYLNPYLVKARYNLQKYGKGQKSYSLTSTYTTDYTTGGNKQVIKVDTTWHFINEEEVKAIESLIAELKAMKSLSILRPSKGIYNAAKKHALDQIPTGTMNHLGTDGSWPWDRIKKYAPEMEEGNENIACGENKALEVVIQLLIDSGIPGYGHRKTLVNPKWTHCACYCAGVINKDVNCTHWIQNFGATKVKKM